MYQLFTIKDSTTGNRINPPTSVSMSTFLSPPLFPSQLPTNTTLTTWKMNPFLECNFIFVSDAEMAHIATTDHSFMLTQIDVREAHGQHGASNDLELNMRNLCTRIIWVGQRSDRALLNDFDNYTNWQNPYVPPISDLTLSTSGIIRPPGITTRDILIESNIVIDGKDRFSVKQSEFFRNIQNYRHHTGRTIIDLPGIYTYSFALEHDSTQPSGHINGSQFNRTILRNTYVEPPLASVFGISSPADEVCVLKSTANSSKPVIVPEDRVGNYSPEQLVRIIRKTEANTLAYTYTVRAFVESYNFLRVMGGIANVVFSS
jgi:hypothetical protein